MVTMKTIHVVAAVLEKHGKYFIAQRPQDKQLGGFWEFPGGKVEQGETHSEALKREMMEEFDAEITVGEFIVSTENVIGDRTVVLHFYRSYLKTDRLTPLEHEDTAWLSTDELERYQLAPADRDVVPFL